MTARRKLPITLTLSATALLVLAGCASVSPQQNQDRVNQEVSVFAGDQVLLARTREDQDARAQAVEKLLAAPLTQPAAVQLALAGSPSVQVLLAQGWADTADAAQSGRISNPIFSFGRLVSGDGLELDRALSFGLLDLLTLPARHGVATRRIEQAQLRLSIDVVDQVTRVRLAWVRAVAAQQALHYAQQVVGSAAAAAELARRMQGVGNWSRLERAREQAFYADAATRLALAQHQATAGREELVRELGLSEAQAQVLKLPERLPDLPGQPLDAQAVAGLATRARLDIRLAQATLDAAARAQGLTGIISFTDIELTGRRNTVFDAASGTRSSPHGWDVAVRLPVFDWGGMQRDAMDARTLAAANRLEATVRGAGSSLREGYSAYRTAHDVARHYRDEVVPLRKRISDENQLRYNGMLISTFELLADARDQVNAVAGAVDALRQFWLADAALRASVVGRPVGTSLSATSSAPGTADAGH